MATASSFLVHSVAAMLLLNLFSAKFLPAFGFTNTEPTISASPAVLPYEDPSNNPSSFFPSPTGEWPDGPAAAPSQEDGFPPMPTSGEFLGKKNSASGYLLVKFSNLLLGSGLVVHLCVSYCLF
ncbi:unnamed protein product [Linum tenue]|uniref:Uncharacterized protein n=1 Tax=Linum tenue TaxID=586396 RepID=A0AAV0R3B7_9ROSI|nr:unnamed protein product [Linum tenue]